MYLMRPRALSIVLLLAGPAHAQLAPEFLRPVDQGVEDTSPLNTSLRYVEFGLDAPSGFGRVYQVIAEEGTYVRANGAIYAAFPRSQYRRTSKGVLVEVPADTVFHIGAPPEWLDEPSGSFGVQNQAGTVLPPNRVENFVRPASTADMARSVREETEAEAFVEPPPVLPPIVADHGYRTRRWAAMLASASAGEDR